MSRPTLIVALFVLFGLAAPAANAADGFVTRSGTELRLDGQPYRFAGINVYNANSTGLCWYPLASGPELGASLDAMGRGAKVIRAWFFQGMATTTGGARDWSAFDHTLAVAAAHGAKVIPTLANQWADCDGPQGGPGAYKDSAWYTTGYKSGPDSYRDWVAEIAARYKDDPAILAWQLINEAEVYPSQGGTCEAGAAAVLKSWAADVSAAVKAADPNHLVSLGTLGNGPCGTSFNEYQDVHDVVTIDLCGYHDYGSPTVGIPGDVFNGLQKRIDQCAVLDKPLIVDETGIEPDTIPDDTQPSFPLNNRANAFEQKFRAQFGKGIAGELVWAWNKDGSDESGFDVGPGDPALRVLTVWNSPSPGTVTRASTTAAGGQADNRSIAPHLTPDGRYVLFSSEAALTPDDTQGSGNCGAVDVYIKDTTTGSVQLVNVDSGEQQLHGPCGAFGDGISADGRYVLFESDAGHAAGESEVYVRDRVAGTTRSLTAGANGRSGNASMTPDGRFVLFGSEATNLGPGGGCGFHWQQYVYDLSTNAIERVSADRAGDDPCRSNGANLGQISADGRFVAFQTDEDIVDADVGQFRDLDVYLRDRQTADVMPVSVDRDGVPALAFSPAISADGGSVAFVSESSNIVAGDTNGNQRTRGFDVFVWDRTSGAIERASTDGAGHEFESAFSPALSDRGRFVAFRAGRSPLFSGDSSGYADLYVHDRQTGTTERVVNARGLPGGGFAEGPDFRGTGRFLAFAATGSDFVTGDTNDAEDVFVHERSGPAEPPLPPPPPPDANGDGVIDTIAGPTPGSFDDHAGTTGSITNRHGLAVTVSDAAAPEGVHIVVGPGTGHAAFSVCGFTLQLTAGSDAFVTCGSVRVRVVSGRAELVLGGGISTVSVPAGVTGRVTDTGSGTYKVEDLGGGAITLTVEGVVTTVAAGATGQVAAWRFQGFAPPVANPPAVNTVEAGQLVPLGWRLLKADGSPVTTLKTAKLTATGLACNLGSKPSLAAEKTTALKHLGRGVYGLVWATPKSYATSCKTVRLDLGFGIIREARFRFPR